MADADSTAIVALQPFQEPQEGHLFKLTAAASTRWPRLSKVENPR